MNTTRHRRDHWRDLWVRVAILVCLCGTVEAARFAAPVDDVARVYQTIAARLAVMPDVAAAKWSRQLPIYDAEREHEILERAATRAAELGLNTQSVRAIFAAQLDMARAVQEALFETWRERGFPEQPIRDLDSDLRPTLDRLGEQQLAALYWAREHLTNVAITDETAKSLREMSALPGVTAQNLAELRAALHALRAQGGRIDTIAQLRVLRIGTTGDYAPFTWEYDGELHGADIELAEDLAAHLGLEPRFVPTTWPTLLQDLKADRFDLAVSGISNTPERAAQAAFSTAYHFDGKTPLARCTERSRFTSLNDIDQPNVRIIVNRGGTNEQFVREHIVQARILVHADNRTVFDELIAGRADVMITDAIEADLQTRRHKELCRTLSSTLTNTAKAILLPRDSPLFDRVDRWLQTEIARGAVRERLQRALKDAEARY